MSLKESSSIDFVHQQRLDRTSKRKLDDYGPLDEDFSGLVSVRTKKEALHAVNSFSSAEPRVLDNRSDQICSLNSEDVGEIGNLKKSVHFFVRMMSGGNTLVIHGNLDDSVESVHEQIREITGIPTFEQRLIYRGRQLQSEQTLGECDIENDAGLQLVGRMRSTDYPKTWRCVTDLLHAICCLCRADAPGYPKIVKVRVKEFLKMMPEDNYDRALGHINIFRSSGGPSALVMLYLSPFRENRECAEESIGMLLSPHINALSRSIQLQCGPIVLEFCKLLSGVPKDDVLYVSSRSTLGYLLETIGYEDLSKYFDFTMPYDVIVELSPIAFELARRICLTLDEKLKELCQSLESNTDGYMCLGQTLACDAHDFAALLLPICRAIEEHVGGLGCLPIHLHENEPYYMAEINSIHDVFMLLMKNIDGCLKKVEGILTSKGELKEGDGWQIGSYQCLPVLRELHRISKLFQGAEETFGSFMRSRRQSLNVLIRYSERSDDHFWILEYKGVMDFESKRHLVMMMFADVKEDYEGLHEMLIDRSHLLEESFEYIGHTSPESLRGGLFMEFKNEEATGPGVLREWFYMVCQAIFNPQNPLFMTCPNDHRRFLPNPASKVDSLHLDYFGFCGRVIALALMHKMQVGIVFDRVFFLQLANKLVSLEDVRDADPCFYKSCKRILEMDAEFLDSDALGLTFVLEIEELGSRKVVELCPGGKDIIVNSKNREKYVNLHIQHRFVKSTSEQVARFAQGFGDILSNSELKTLFFQSLELEDFDRMLHGSDIAISILDWKAHTEYNGYKETDRQICWFWKVVEGMAQEQQRVLLFFWTSIRYLPLDGFGGLASRLYIYKASDSHDRLPSSHTCFYRLCLPPYTSLRMMRERLRIITQEHVSCSFGNW